MKRRSFLRTAGTASAAAAAGVFSILKYPRGARAAGWGAWPGDRADLRLPDDLIAQNVLEVQLNGGMSPWDTFYTVPGWDDDLRYVHQFSPEAGNFEGQLNRDERFAACGYGEGEPLWVESGISDGDGVPLFLGPWTVPWRNRMDILSRMRIVVQRHDNVAHEGANPLCLTGDRLGQPRLAGLGTAVQRYFTENPEAGGGTRTTPYSYVLYPGTGYNQANTLSASAVGFHPGSARPLGVPVSPNSSLANLLARSGPADPAAFDAAITYYRQQYEARFRTSSIGAPTRSAERANYEFADFARRNAPDLQAILTPEQFAMIASPNPAECGGGPGNGVDMPRMQARLAANLLTREDGQARFVLWVDTGVNPHPTGGHDNHTFHSAFAAQNVPHTLAAIAEVIGQGPGLIDLDRTMIILNTEFGRTPHRQQQAGQTGTNHWPWGYITIFIGGPIRNPGCYGRIGYVPGFGIEESEDGYAVDYVTPAENRMMAMQAMGIYPFSSQSFAVGDVRGGVADEEAAAARVRETYLGVS
jgi:hypothetical protein